MKISFKQFWLLLVCWQKRMPFGTTIEITGLSHITVRRWFRCFRYQLVYESPMLRGMVEVDEACVGKRRHNNQKVVLGAMERHTGKGVVRMTHNRDQETTDRFLLKHVKTSATVCTDGALCYEGIDAFFGYKHVECNHSKFIFGDTNGIENVWSRMKRIIRRTHHHLHKEWLPHFLRECEARMNTPKLFQNPRHYLSICLTVVPIG